MWAPVPLHNGTSGTCRRTRTRRASGPRAFAFLAILGGIVGAAGSGFILIHAFGVERSLQLLMAVNVGVGLVICVSLLRPRQLPWAAAASTCALLVALAGWPNWGRFWDLKYFAIYRNNHRAAFETPEKVRDALQNTDVVYYFEGANETISVIRPDGSTLGFIVNGRSEATNSPIDMQCQRTLGHLPMLLHPDPRRVFVLGTGTGMTLGATSIQPQVEGITLAEIEPGVIGAARTFAEYNHQVLDDPRLRIVFNDGRNHLATTRERFDVITADPIHPWSGGAAYLYTTEYFRSVAEHLLPGGIACQWLPIYELTVRDVKSVVRTFAENFKYVMVWRTHYDAQLIGSDSPITLDEQELGRRIAQRGIALDLREVEMGTAEDFLSYFVLGTEGARAFGREGILNTDDNLHLEFSAPRSMGVGGLTGENAAALAGARESVLPYLEAPLEEERQARWARNLAAARLYDRAHALFLWGEVEGPEFGELMTRLEQSHPDYAPFRFLKEEYRRRAAATPRLASHQSFPVTTAGGARRLLHLAAVTMRLGETRGVVMFVDNEKREIYGQRYLDGASEQLDGLQQRLAEEGMSALRRAYEEVLAEGRLQGDAAPSEEAAVKSLKDRLAAELAAPWP